MKEDTCLQTPPPAQLTPGWQQVQHEMGLAHDWNVLMSLPRWFLLSRKPGLFSRIHAANDFAGTKLGILSMGSDAESCPFLSPTQAIVSQQPQEPKNNKTLSLPGITQAGVSVHSVIPFYITTGASVPTALEEMGLKKSRNQSSQLPQSGG